MKAVQNVIENLLIARLEVRHPDDPDVKRHSFQTLEDIRVVKARRRRHVFTHTHTHTHTGRLFVCVSE